MSLIDHPNTLRAYCSFTVGHNLWVVMPYLAGGSALHIMKYAYPEGFEEPVIATLLYEVLKALAYLHAQGHIHRDVKAGNILIDAKGAVKLADFGVSASMFDTGDRQRARNTFVGTPCWMAPEVMQQLHGYDFKADIWSFGITALELAHGHAPFSKYPPMKVLLMTLQNAPPGLDYERDKRFSKSFKEMLAACLVKDPKRRPTSEKLLKHPFFKHACSNEYSIQSILEGLSPLGERFKALKGREANILLQHKGASNELEQQEYTRGISGWNFNLEDLKSQASLICSLDDVHCTENTDGDTNLKKGYGNIGSSGLDEKDNFANNEDSREDLLQEMQDLEGPLASAFPSRPLEALKACFDVSEDMSATTSTQVIQSQLTTVTSQLQASVTKNYRFDMENGEAVENPSVSLNMDSHVCQKFSVDSLLFERILSPHRNVDADTQRDCIKWSCQRERNHSGSLFHQIKDLPNVTSVEHEEPLERKVIQRKGRFQITFPNPTPKVASSANVLTSAVNTAALIPSLQFLWHQNAMQKELLIKLTNCLEQTSSTSGGNHTEVSDNNTGDSQLSLASGTERILQAHLTTLQNSVSRLNEEVQKLKLKNFYLKQQINSLSSARKDDKIVKQ